MRVVISYLREENYVINLGRGRRYLTELARKSSKLSPINRDFQILPVPEEVMYSLSDEGLIDVFADGSFSNFRRFLPIEENDKFFARIHYATKMSTSSREIFVHETMFLRNFAQVRSHLEEKNQIEIEYENSISEDKSTYCQRRSEISHRIIDANNIELMWLACLYDYKALPTLLTSANLPMIVDHDFNDASTVTYYDGSSGLFNDLSEVWDLWSEDLSIIEISDDEVSELYLTFFMFS